MRVLQSQVLRPEFSPRSIIRALWKWNLSVLALWLLGSAATIITVYSLRPRYDAEAVILVESQKIPEAFVASTVQTVLEARLDMLKQKVLSFERLWSLIQELDLYSTQRLTRTREEVFEMMRRDITITLERRWSASRPVAFRVGYRAWSPHIAAEVANRIGRFFINENLREREVEAEGTSEFLDSQLAQAKKELEQQEAKLREFKLAHNGELPQQESTLLASMGQSRAELLGIQDALSRAQQNKLILESSLGVVQINIRRQQDSIQRRVEMLPEAIAASSVQPGQPTGLERVQQLRALRLRYHDKHPEVQRLLQELARLSGASEAAADAPGEEAPPAEKEQVEALKSQIAMVAREMKSLEARRQRVLNEIAEIQSRIQRLPANEQQLTAITRDYDTRKANYQSLLNKKLAADVSTDMERWKKAERFVMLDEARPPEKPAWPRRILLTAAGTMFSLLAAAATTFLLELKNNVILGEWELPADIVVLGRMPRMKIKNA